MNSDSFQLITSDTGSYSWPCGIEIALQKFFRKRSHGQAGYVAALVQDLPVPHHRDRRMQFMSLSAQGQELVVCSCAIFRLGEPGLAERQRLVRAEDDAAG